ncbi:MAG: hypothetical protein K5989_06550, partial [Lachnospiraceae bacterium]|nr:hypothetical protein [Lachnospiraceae bacterium]
MKKFFSKNSKKIVVFLLAAAVGTTTIFMSMKHNTMALFNEKEAMRYSAYRANHTIEDSVLFIGTYLISMKAMTDELYQKAQTSASDSNQTQVYYKSELAGGSWFDVTDAEGLADISGGGEIIEESKLANLYVQYYVDSSGAVTDVMTGSTINPFSTPDPYDLKKLPELQALWMQFTGSEGADSISLEEYLENKNSKKSGNLRTDIYNYRIISTFFSMDLRDNETDRLDASLSRLFACYQTLKSSGRDEEAEIIYSLMSKVDGSRRANIMGKLASNNVNVLGVVYELENGKYYTSFGDFKDSSDEDDITGEPDYLRDLRDAVEHHFTEDDDSDAWWSELQENYDKYVDEKDDDENAKEPSDAFKPDEGLLSAIADSIASCQESYNTYNSNALTDSDTVLGHAEYEYSNQVLDQANASGETGPINYLIDVQNIANGVVKNAEREKTLLDRSLLNLAEGKYESAVTAGVSKEYQSALSGGGGLTAAENVLSSDFDKVESRRSELEFLIDAFRQRAEPATALSYINACKESTNKLYGQVPNDTFTAKANGSIDSHMKWLNDGANQVKNQDESLKTKLDELNEKKEKLQAKRDAALDDDDLAGAKKYDAQIAALDNDIAEEEAKTGTSAADNIVKNVTNDALAKIAKDPDADISGELGALASMGAQSEIEKIKDRAAQAGASAASLQSIDNAGKDAKEAVENGTSARGTDDSGSGTGSGSGGSGTDGTGGSGAGGSGTGGSGTGGAGTGGSGTGGSGTGGSGTGGAGTGGAGTGGAGTGGTGTGGSGTGGSGTSGTGTGGAGTGGSGTGGAGTGGTGTGGTGGSGTGGAGTGGSGTGGAGTGGTGGSGTGGAGTGGSGTGGSGTGGAGTGGSGTGGSGTGGAGGSGSGGAGTGG